MAKRKEKVASTPGVKVSEAPRLRYKFGAIEVVEYYGHSLKKLGITPGPQALNLNFNVQMNFGLALDINNANPAIVVTPELTCSLEENHAEIICYLKTNLYFPVEGLDLSIGGSIESQFPEAFLAELVNLALGTARGILYAKNFGTPYALTVMPPMDIKSLIPKGPWLMPPNPTEVEY
jgi:hypothetical protein